MRKRIEIHKHAGQIRYQGEQKMILELNKQDFYKIRHIAEQCQNIEVKAIVYRK